MKLIDLFIGGGVLWMAYLYYVGAPVLASMVATVALILLVWRLMDRNREGTGEMEGVPEHIDDMARYTGDHSDSDSATHE